MQRESEGVLSRVRCVPGSDWLECVPLLYAIRSFLRLPSSLRGVPSGFLPLHNLPQEGGTRYSPANVSIQRTPSIETADKPYRMFSNSALVSGDVEREDM